MSWLTKIEDLIGTVSDTGAVTQWLRDGAWDIIRRVKMTDPMSLSLFMSTDTTSWSGDTLAIGNNLIMNVFRSNYKCREIPASYKNIADETITGSLYAASGSDPVFYKESGNIAVIPADGTNSADIVTIDTTNLAHGQSSVDNFPEDMEYLIVLYAALQGLQRKMADGVLSVTTVFPVVPSIDTVSFSVSNALSITAISPVLIPLTEVSYTGIPDVDTGAVSDISTTLVSIAGTAPSYNSGAVIGMLGDTLIHDLASLSIDDLGVTTVAPVVPSLDSVTFTSVDSTFDASAPVFATATISASSTYTGSAPVYTKPAIVLGAAPTISDLSISSVPPDVPSLATVSFSDVGSDVDASGPIISVATVSAGGVFGANTVPTYAKPGHPAQVSFEDFFHLSEDGNPFGDNDPGVLSLTVVAPEAPTIPGYDIGFDALPSVATIVGGSDQGWQAAFDEEDLDKAKEALSRRAQMFKENKDVFDSEMEKAKEQVEALVNRAKHEDDSETQAKLSLYQAELTDYQQTITKETSEYGQNLDRYKTEATAAFQAWAKTESDNIQVFQADIQNELNEFNKENISFQANIQEAMQEIQVANQVNIAQGQADLQLAMDNKNRSQQRQLQNSINNMQGAVQNNDDLIAKYSAELQQYQAKVGMEVQEYQQNLQGDLQVWQAERQTDLQKYASDIQNELNEFNKENVAYQSAIQESIQNLQIANQVNIADAQAQLQVAIANEDRDLQRQLQNGINDMQAIVGDNQRKIVLFQSESSQFQADVSKEVQEWQANTNKDLQIWQQTQQLALQEQGQRMQDALNLFNEENAEYQAEVQVSILQAQTSAQESLQNLQKDLQIAIRDADRSQEHQVQEKIQDVQAIIADNQRKITQYQSEAQHYATQVNEDVQSYTSQLQADVQEMQAIIANNQSILNKYQFEITNAQAESAVGVQESQLKMQQYQMQYIQLKQQYEQGFVPFQAPQREERK
ncbi:MAG: hypothetical protein H8D23_17975 [Candidatus Brocadiales bacterium]|nr:hypothetical protein [Candidatus Brocadiales bacterium]